MSFLIPILTVIVTWWVGTGVVLYLQQRLTPARKPLMISLVLVATSSLLVMTIAAGGSSAWHSYCGFIAAITLWGSIELSYYTGLVSGVHRRICPADCDTGKRFRLALGASIWHELSVLFSGGVVMTLLHDTENPAGLYSFLVLWLMRWSAKLNLFFGMPNFNTDWFPKRMAYAHSYIRRAQITWFFPFSMLLASSVAAYLIAAALSYPPEQSLMIMLPGVLLLLAILEHVFMALPISDSELWNRIFARDDDPSQAVNDEDAARQAAEACSQRIQARTQARIHQALTVSTNRKVSVTLNTVEATATPSVSQ